MYIIQVHVHHRTTAHTSTRTSTMFTAQNSPNNTHYQIFHAVLFTHLIFINILMPNVNYSGHTVPLTSKVAFYIFIQQI